jgi:hypothetical protein
MMTDKLRASFSLRVALPALLTALTGVAGCGASNSSSAGTPTDVDGATPGTTPDAGATTVDGAPGVDGAVTTPAIDGPAAPSGTPVGPGGGAAWTPKGGMKVGTNLWGLEWGIWDDLFKPAVDFSSVENPWRQPFLNEVSHYSVIRFMDFETINNSMEQHWADRTQKQYPASQQIRLAYEWMIDLCNRTNTDMWINIPHLADQDYVNQLATLIQTTLKPTLKVYIEWSNETWNTEFAQTQYAYDQGNALALDADKWAAAFKYHVYAAVRVFAQFEAIFGKNSDRLVKVIAGEFDNSWVTMQHMDALKDPKINPDNIVVNAYALAPYFGEGVDFNGPDPMGRLAESIDGVKTRVQEQSAMVTAAGLSLVAYEGGQHSRENADMLNAQPQMYQVYTDYLNALAPSMKLLVHYCHNGSWNEEEAWGAEQAVGEPLSKAHKLRAIFDWIGGP